MGTPAYMAPEQARGEWDKVDARADVFALGGILAAMLTGSPPFVAETTHMAMLMSATERVADVYARLDATGFDAELLALAKRCLHAKADDRPASGEAVANAVAAYQAGVAARLRQAETDRAASAAKAEEARLRAAAEARATRAAEGRADEADRRADAEAAQAKEQRRRRRWQLMAAGAVACIIFGGGAFAWWRDAQATEREAERRSAQARADADQVRREKDEAERVQAVKQARTGVQSALKLAEDLRGQQKFREAGEAVAQAEKLAPGGAADLLPAVRREKAAVALARDLAAVLRRKWTWVTNPDGQSGKFDADSAPAAYAATFAAHGLDIAAGDPAALAQKIEKAPIRSDILRALDDWAVTVEARSRADAAKVLDVAHCAGPPGELATKLRDPAVRYDAARFFKLVEYADEVAASVPATLAASALLERRKTDPSVLLAVAQAKHPADFDLTMALALWFHERDPARAIGHYRAARALQPGQPTVLTNLGLLLGEAGETAAAAAVLKEAVRLHPNDHLAHFNLGGVLIRQELYAEAEAEYRAAIALSPNYAAAHGNLGSVLGSLKKHGDAVAPLREAIRLAPDDAAVRSNYGLALQRTGDLDGALREYRKSVELDPKYAPGHLNVGVILEKKKDLPGAFKAYREAARLDPKQYGSLLKKLPPEK